MCLSGPWILELYVVHVCLLCVCKYVFVSRSNMAVIVLVNVLEQLFFFFFLIIAFLLLQFQEQLHNTDGTAGQCYADKPSAFISQGGEKDKEGQMSMIHVITSEKKGRRWWLLPLPVLPGQRLSLNRARGGIWMLFDDCRAPRRHPGRHRKKNETWSKWCLKCKSFKKPFQFLWQYRVVRK